MRKTIFDIDIESICVHCLKQSGDISSHHSKIVLTELKPFNETHLQPKDFKNATLVSHVETKNNKNAEKYFFLVEKSYQIAEMKCTAYHK